MAISNYDLFQKRLETSDAISKDSLIKSKQNTFKKALKSAYNSELVDFNGAKIRSIISEIDRVNKVERKKFATLNDYECEVGKYIYWIRNDSYWLITEYYETEPAIFSGEISYAGYLIKWKDLKTGIVYSTRASAQGPQETKISSNMNKDLQFDKSTDGITVIIPKNIEGISLLNRYAEVLINNKKWVINVVDDITKDKLIVLQLKETPINKDLDSLENNLVNDKIETIFTLKSELDNILEVDISTSITLNPILFRNDEIVDTYTYEYYLTNCIQNNNIITFNGYGAVVITLYYKDINKSFTYNITSVASDANLISSTSILGSNSIKALNTYLYKIENLINGVSYPIIGSWNINTDYASILSSSNDELLIKVNNKIGSFNIEYVTDTNTYLKQIKVTPIFGG